MAKRRNIGAEAVIVLRRQRHWGVEDFDRAWDAMWTKLFARSLPHTTSREWRVELDQWKRALRFARPAFEAAWNNEPCPMVEHFPYIPALATSRDQVVGIDLEELRENGTTRAIELAGVAD